MVADDDGTPKEWPKPMKTADNCSVRIHKLVVAVLLVCCILGSGQASSQTPQSIVEPLTRQPAFWVGLDTSSREAPRMTFGPRGMRWRSSAALTRLFTRQQSIDAQRPWSMNTQITIDSVTPSLAVAVFCGTATRRIVFYYRPADHATGTRENSIAANTWRALGTAHRDSIFRPATGPRPNGSTFNLSLARKGASLVVQVNGATLDSLVGQEAQPIFDEPTVTIGLAIHGVGIATFSNLTVTAFLPEFPVAPASFQRVHRTYARELNRDTAQFSDRAPKVAPNGAAIYLVRSTRDSGDVIFTALRQSDSTWHDAYNIGPPLNNTSPNSVIGISQDNNQLTLWGRYKADGSSDGVGLSSSTRTAAGWSVPTNITMTGYKNYSRHREETISPDGSVIILSYQADSTRKNVKDLYVSRRLAPGEYGTPVRIPEPVSSAFNELSPTIAADGKTLYFSSNRPGFGDADVWVCKRLDDTWLSWTEPVNLGPGVNTPGWDAFFTIHPSGRYAYVRTSDGFRTGIYRLTLPQRAANASVLPHPTTVVSGRVVNGATNQPLGGAIKVVAMDGSMTSTAISEPANGEYSIVLPSGHDYAFYAERDGFFPVSQHVRLATSSIPSTVRQDLVLFPLTVHSTILLNNVFFETDRYDLQDDSREELLRLVSMLQQRPTMQIEIGGHTDDRASAAHNLTLSEKRAQAVRDFLQHAGIAPSRLTAKGYGKTKPLERGTTEAARQRNRRVEFTVVKE